MADSYATGSVDGMNAAGPAGGLIGANYGGVNSSYAAGSVSGGSDVGGLVGLNAGTVSGSAQGNVSGTGNYVGGLVAVNSGTVSSSYATGPVSGTGNDVGGLVGYNLATISESFWNVGTSGLTTSAGGIGLTTAQMQKESTFTAVGWNFTSIWYMPSGSYPVLQAFMTAPAGTANDSAMAHEVGSSLGSLRVHGTAPQR